MVEMLGVLAIIGVLSIGGIQGYTMAMRRYRANEIINVANKYASILYHSCQQARLNDPVSYPTKAQGEFVSESYGSFNFVSRSQCPQFVAFSDSGLGSLPSGALKINDSDTGIFGLERFPAFSTTSDGKDIIFISIKLDTQELCETVLTIAGDPNYNSWAEDISSRYTGSNGNCTKAIDWGDGGETTWVVIPVIFN